MVWCPNCGHKLRKTTPGRWFCDNCEYEGDGCDRDISGNVIYDPNEGKPE
jgi:hypothetical protein